MKVSARLRSQGGGVGDARPKRKGDASPSTSAEPTTDETPVLAGMDAIERLQALNKAFSEPPEAAPVSAPEAEVAPSPGADAATRLKRWVRQNHRRLIKTCAGLAIVLVVGWIPVRALLETTSTEAVLNARLITLRAPIEGQIQGLTPLTVGSELAPGTTLVSIANPRAERGRLDDLRRLLDELDGDIKTLGAKRTELIALQRELTIQTQAFRAARIDQLDARLAEVGSDISAAEARRVEADQALARARVLGVAGTGTKVTLERAERDARVAMQNLLSLGHKKSALQIELTALRKDGVYVGDSYNDRPQSLQRADDIALRLNELNTEIEQRTTRRALVRSELTQEENRYAERSAASLASPVRGSVWEIMTAPGETVSRGQDLVRVLDCSGLVVTATVGETAYNQLHIGQSARFRFRGESTAFDGRIIGLTGVATAAANLAIQPSALAKEPYRVTVALPELAKPGPCNVGRTGRVTFGG